MNFWYVMIGAICGISFLLFLLSCVRYTENEELSKEQIAYRKKMFHGSLVTFSSSSLYILLTFFYLQG